MHLPVNAFAFFLSYCEYFEHPSPNTKDVAIRPLTMIVSIGMRNQWNEFNDYDNQ